MEFFLISDNWPQKDPADYQSPGGPYQYVWMDRGRRQEEDLDSSCPLAQDHGPDWWPPHSLSVVLKWQKLGGLIWGLHDLALPTATLELFRRYGVSGFDARPVQIEQKPKSVKLDGLWHVYVTGKASADFNASGIERISKCHLCGAVRFSSWDSHSGIVVDESTWDGCDLVRVHPFEGFIVATRKVYDLVVEHDLRPACLVDLRRLT